MECPVCYENSVNCTLVCGHKFCKSCVKTWYLKGSTTESGCPMCRRKVHYRRMPIKKWNAEAEEEKKTVVFQESFDDMLEVIMKPLKYEIRDSSEIPNTPGFTQSISEDGKVLTLHRVNMPTYELEDLEKTFRAIKDECSPDELDYVLNETEEYYSDRRTHLCKRGGYSEMCYRYKHANRNRRSNGRARVY
jgi:hypothetical protein